MSVEMIDTHAHLQWEKFDDDRDDVIARAIAAGVRRIVTLATDLASSHRVLELAEKYECVFAAVGVHPTDAAAASPGDLKEIESLAAHPKVVAIGETGMDFYWDKTTAAVQESMFVAQLDLAQRKDLPVVVHNRDAGAAIRRILKAHPELQPRGVFHCFGEDPALAEEVLGRGFHISFTGNITYKKSGLPDVSLTVPLDRLLLETDSPFLTPVPHRGKRNEPAFVRHIAEKHAEIRELTVEELCAATTGNAETLFRFPTPDPAR